MLRLIKTEEYGMECYFVVWSESEGGVYKRQYLSEEYARQFIRTKFAHISHTVKMEYMVSEQRKKLVA